VLCGCASAVFVCGEVFFCELVCVFLCASVFGVACSEVVVEFVKDYVGVGEGVAVGEVDGFVFDDVAGLVFCVAFGHTYLKLYYRNMVVLT